MRPLTAIAVVWFAAFPAPPARADSFHLTPDVPSVLGGAMHLPSEVARNDAGAYTTVLAVPAGASIDALHRMDGGDWLLSFRAPTAWGATTFHPGDVARYDPSSGSVAVFFDHATIGLGAATNVDALFLDGGDAGDPILSFDVPTTTGPDTWLPADLVRHTAGGFSSYFDSAAAGIPLSTNVTGADVRAGAVILTFDVATTLSATAFLPGELVRWNGVSFSSHYLDPAWPVAGHTDALGFLADPGCVPTIHLDRTPIAPTLLVVSWTSSCSSGAEDYGIYEGQLGDWTSHGAIDCHDDGADRTEQIVPASANTYYLVVPFNANDEGSYGVDGWGIERPRGNPTCATTQTISMCP